jgi:hypothetical protein
MRNRIPAYRSSNARSFGSALFPGRSASSSSSTAAKRTNAVPADPPAPAPSPPSPSVVMFDGMDEDEIVARIMQQVRECESSSRRNLRRPKNGISYRLDKNGSIVPVPSGEEWDEDNDEEEPDIAAASGRGGLAAASSSPSSDPASQRGGGAGGRGRGRGANGSSNKSGRQLYSVDDCRKPVPSYQVEVNTDRVGSFYRDEMDDAFQYLMSGTPRRNQRAAKEQQQQRRQEQPPSHPQGASRRGRAAGVAPRYMSVGKGKDDSDESFVEQYDLVQYEEESVTPRTFRSAAAAVPTPVALGRTKAAPAVVAPAPTPAPMTPRRGRSVVLDVKAAPHPVLVKAEPIRVPPVEESAVALNQSTSTHSSSSSSSAASPVPSSPNQAAGGWKADVDKARAIMASGASVVTVPPTDAPPSAMCAMGWMRGGGGETNLFRANHSCSGGGVVHQNNKNATGLESPSPTGAPATPPATAPTATLYERLALPLCRATSTVETAESYRQWHEPSEDLSREPSYTISDVEAMMRRTTTITTVATQASASPHEEEEEDMDILRPWGFASMPWTSKKAASAAPVPMPPRARSTKSATSSVLRTIRESGGSSDRDSNVDEAGSDFDDEEEDDASSFVTTNDELRRRRSNIERRHGSVDPSRYGRRRSTRTDGSSCAGTTVTGTTHASRSTAAFTSRRGDDGSVSECTTLYDPSTSQRKYPPGCMALVQNVWQGIDRAERALLGSMSVDDDLWADLYEDEYDLYSTEMTDDRSGDEDASMSTATSSRWQMTAERSGLTSTLSADDRSHIVSTRRSGSRVAADVPALAKRSPRRSRYLSSSS